MQLGPATSIYSDTPLFVLVILFVPFLFFQAEDGIRDQPRSRGLGDVYKRQRSRPSGSTARVNVPVSYTHLTLPTNREV